MRTLISAIMFCTVFLVANESIRVAHNRLLGVWLPDIYSESSRLTYRDSCRIALLGDSIILTGLDPAIIPGAYNFAWLDAQYLANYFMLDWILRSDPEKLEVIVLPLDRHSFSVRSLKAPTRWQKATLVQAIKADHRDRQRGAYLRSWVRDRVFPYADLPHFIADNTENDRPVLQQGFLGMFGSKVQGPEAFQRSAEIRGRQLFRDESWYDERLGWYLDAILQLATDHGLKVVLVQCPVTREFDAELRKRVSDRAFDQRKAQILAKFPEVTIVNFRDRFLDRHELFHDANHPNYAGAQEFSVLVRDELQRLGLLAS